MFQPAVLNPQPEPWFIKELELIDPDLRVVFGYERYLMKNWVVERRIPPARYARMYFSLLTADAPRFIERPIFDRSKPLYDEDGNEVGFEQIGIQNYDLAPEWEWIKTIQLPDGSFKPLGMDDILDLKRQYAWNRNHAYSRAKFEEEERLKDEQKEKEQKAKRVEIWMEAYDEALLEAGKRVTAKPLTSTFTE